MLKKNYTQDRVCVVFFESVKIFAFFTGLFSIGFFHEFLPKSQEVLRISEFAFSMDD